MQRNKVKKCLLALVLSLTMSLTMLPGAVNAEEIDSKGSGEPKVEEAQGEGQKDQQKVEGKEEAEGADEKVSDTAKEENGDTSDEGKVQKKAVLKAAKAAEGKDSENTIEPKTAGNTIYLNDALSAGADDNNPGTSKDKPVRTFNKAYELAGKGGTIIICGITKWIELDQDLSDVTIKLDDDYDTSGLGSYPTTEVLKVVTKSITFTNVTVDGNKANAKVDSESSPLIYIGPWGELTLNNSVVQNNACWGIDCSNGATLTMNSGSIRNNDYAGSEAGGGLRVSDGAVAYLNGGTIEGNTANAGAGVYISNGVVHLNGTDIKNNTADYNGGAIHMNNSNYSGGTAFTYNTKFEMTGGTITGNTAGGLGGAISAWDGRGAELDIYPGEEHDVIVDIQGGTISGNTAGTNGSAIAVRGDFWGDEVSYSKLRLSGSPDISGEVYLQEDESVNKGAVINVTGEFAPASPVTVKDDNHIEGRDIIKYAEGVAPDLSAFQSGWRDINVGIRYDKDNSQVLEWGEVVPVWFIGKDGSQTQIMVNSGNLIDPASVPEVTNKGYTLDGWNTADGSKWNMAEDVVVNETTLFASWTLNAPEVTIKADKTEAKTGETITLTAVAKHDIKGLPCTYVWYKDGKEIEGQTASTLKVTENGKYSVKVTIADEEGLTAEGMSEDVACTFKAQAASDNTGSGKGNAGTGNNGTNSSVKTGDEASGIMYLVVLLAALGAGITVILRKRAKQF